MRVMPIQRYVVAALFCGLASMLVILITVSTTLRYRAPDIAIKVWPWNGEARGVLAGRMLLKGELLGAQQLAKQAVRQVPGDAISLRALGMLQPARETTGKALRIMQLATKASRRDLQTNLWFIEYYVSQGDITSAIRYYDYGLKSSAEDNTSYGHNVEFAWLLMHALDVAGIPYDDYQTQLLKSFDHAIANGIDWEYGGVYVEGSHEGQVYDREKEFWQQAEVIIGMLDAYRIYGDEKYLNAYNATHGFVFDHMIHTEVGEWLPLLTRKGDPIWKHMSHSWKINYHTVRAMVQGIVRLDKLLNN